MANDISKIKLPGSATEYTVKDNSAITKIERNGTTFIATKRDGTTFTFTQQDNNTTYTLSVGTGNDANKIVLTPSGGTAYKITVPYATSAGSATSASKLGSTTVGSATNPIYLNAGTATACTYSLNKTVPANAVFTDTTYTLSTNDNTVTLTPSSGGIQSITVPYATSAGSATNAYYLQDSVRTNYKLKYINTNDSTTANADTLGETTSIAINMVTPTGAPTTNHALWFNIADIGTPFQLFFPDNQLYIYKRYKTSGTWGDWTKMRAGYADSAGSATSATSATKATQDSDGNAINTTYLKLSGGTMTGSINFPASKGIVSKDSASRDYCLIYDNGSNLWIGATSSTGTHHTGSTYISSGWSGSAGNATIYVAVPTLSGSTWSTQNYAVLHANNYSTYTVPKTGGTFTGNVSVTDTLGIQQTSGTSGGISLYGGTGNVDNYGVAFRTTANKGKHGYVQSDWATYFTMNDNATRGWIFRRNGSGNVASISGEGHLVLNGSLTVGGNTTNTSGGRIVYNSTNQAIDFVFV